MSHNNCLLVFILLCVESCIPLCKEDNPHLLYGINNTSETIFFFCEDLYKQYNKEYPGTTYENYQGLMGGAIGNGGKQRILAGDFDSWSDVLNVDSLTIYVIADSIISKYGWDEAILGSISNALYYTSIDYLDQDFKAIVFPPTEEMRAYIRIFPPYEEVIAKYGKSE